MLPDQTVSENNAQEHPGNISFTLLTGRKHFHHRLACIVKTVHDIPVLLKKWLADGNASSFFLGKVNEKVFKEKIEQKEKGHACLKDCQNLTDTGLYGKKLSIIANLFIQGYDLDFHILFEKDRCGRISLPTYPFTRERYWLPDSKKSQMPEKMHQTDHRESTQKEIETSEPQSSHEKQASISSRAVMMKKSWEICLPAPTRSVRRDVIVLADNRVIMQWPMLIWIILQWLKRRNAPLSVFNGRDGNKPEYLN